MTLLVVLCIGSCDKFWLYPDGAYGYNKTLACRFKRIAKKNNNIFLEDQAANTDLTYVKIKAYFSSNKV